MKTKLLFLTGLFLPALFCSCEKKTDNTAPLRNEYITVYEDSEDNAVNEIQVPLEGIEGGKIHVLSNVALKGRYFVNPTEDETDWFQIKSVEEVEPGHTVVTYDAASLLALNSLDLREGKLSFSCPSASIGKFLNVCQGYQRRFSLDFSDEDDKTLVITGKHTYTTREFSELTMDYFDYISFNVWAETSNEFLSKNITLDITVSGGQFFETRLATYRVNVPLGTGADKSNLQYLLLMGNGTRMSSKTSFTFSTANDDDVYVHIDNFSAYKVSESDVEILGDVEVEIEDEIDWV